MYLDTFWWTLGQVRRKSNVIYSIVDAGWLGILLIMNSSKLLSIKNIEVKHNSNNVGWCWGSEVGAMSNWQPVIRTICG